LAGLGARRKPFGAGSQLVTIGIVRNLIGTAGWIAFWTLAILGTGCILLEWHTIQGMTGLVP
jgi:hypothetical protein